MGDAGGELLDVVGLAHHAAETEGAAVGQHGIGGVAAGDDGVHARIEGEQSVHGVLAAHAAGDGEIHDDQVEGVAGRAGRPVGLDGLRAIGGGHDLQTHAVEQRCHETADILFVVHC